MKHIFSILLFFSFFALKSQSGIEPSSFQATPYENGILKGVIPIVDEFTGETVYLYQHDTLGFNISDIFIDNDSLYYVIGTDTFNVGNFENRYVDSIFRSSSFIHYVIGGDTMMFRLTKVRTDEDYFYIDNPSEGDIITSDFYGETYIYNGVEWKVLDYDNSRNNEGNITFDDFSGYRRASFRSNTNPFARKDIVSDSTIQVFINSGKVNIRVDTAYTHSYVRDIISDSLATISFPTDTALIETIVTNSLDTLTLPIDSTILVAGTSMTVWQSPANTWNIQNDDPDQTVTLTPTGIISVSGAYPNFTIGATEVDGSTTNEIQTLSQSFTGTTEATYTLSNSGGSVKDTTGFMRLETMFSTAGSRTYRYKSNLGAIMGITEDPTLSGNSNIEVLRTGNQLTWGLRKDNASSGQIYKYNGTAWALTSDASGISSLNGLTPSTQTFATGTSGTDFNISSATSTHTFNFPTASASNRGLLSSANWTTFNNKLGSLNGLTAATQTFSATTNANDFTITSSGSNHAFNLPFTGNNLGIRLGLNSLRRDNSVALGISCMQNSGASAANNIAIGNDVLKVAGSTGSGGTNNVGLGFQSLLSLTTGIDNMAIGTYSLANLTSGAQNVGIGTIAGLTLTNQSNNVFIGYEAGRFNTGSGSVFIGNQAGRSITASNKLNIDNTDTSTPLIGGDFSTNSAIINGDLTVTTRTGTATQLLGNDSNGKLINLGLTGLTISGGNLVGAAPLSGTLNAIPYFNTTTTLGSMPITYSTALPAMVFPTGNAIHLVGTATIIDKNNSYGSAGEVLSKASGGGVDWIPVEGTDLAFNTKVGTDVPLVSSTGPGTAPKFRDGTNILLTQVSSSVMSVNTNVAHAMMNNTANLTGLTLDAAYRKVTFSSGGIANKITFSDANDRLTVTETGTYEITYSFSLQTGTPYQATVYASLYKNGASAGYQGETIFRNHDNTSSNFTSVCKTFFLTLNSTDYIELFYGNSPSTTTCSILNANVTIKRIN